MYLWKCWRETKGAFLVFLTALGITGIFYFSVAYKWLRGAALEQAADSVLGMFLFLMPLTGFVLGALGIGQEFSMHTLPFLLTRPRGRAYFIWASWGAGALEVLILWLAFALLMVFRPAMPHYPVMLYTPQGALSLFVRVGVLSVFFYSLTFFFTIFFGKEQHGTNAAVGFVAVYSAVVVLLRKLYELNIPSFWDLYSGALRSVAPISAVLGWLGVSLALIFLSSRLFRATEQ